MNQNISNNSTQYNASRVPGPPSGPPPSRPPQYNASRLPGPPSGPPPSRPPQYNAARVPGPPSGPPPSRPVQFNQPTPSQKSNFSPSPSQYKSFMPSSSSDISKIHNLELSQSNQNFQNKINSASITMIVLAITMMISSIIITYSQYKINELNKNLTFENKAAVLNWRWAQIIFSIILVISILLLAYISGMDFLAVGRLFRLFGM